MMIGTFNFHDFRHQTIVDVIDLADIQRHISRGLDRRAVVIQYGRLAAGEQITVKRAADSQIAAAVDQSVVAVVQRLYADIQPIARRESRCDAVLRQIFERAGKQGYVVAVETSAADVEDLSGGNMRQAAVEQSTVSR